MSGPVLDFDPQVSARDDAPGADTRPAPGFLETAGAAMRLAVDEVSDVQASRRAEAYAPLVEALVERGVRRRDLGHDAPGFFGVGTRKGGGAYDYAKIWREAKRLGIEGLPNDQAAFEENALRRGGERTRDQETAARGGIVANFVGGAVGTFRDPFNLYTLPLGGGGGTVARKVLTEGVANAAIEAVQLGERKHNRAELGEGYTGGQMVEDVAGAFAGGAALRGMIEAVPIVDAAGRRTLAPVRDAIDAAFADRDLARAFARQVPQHLRTPEQDAALHVLTRQALVDEASPYARTHEGIDAHRARIDAAMDALEEGRIVREGELVDAPERLNGGSSVAPVRVAAPAPDFDAVKALIRGPESGGNDRATNALGSSASGRYQFIRSTFVRLFERTFGGDGAAAWRNRRFDPAVQERLMDRLLADNAAALERAGVAADAGNLYLAHFAGARKAIELARAPRDAPVSDFFTAQAIAQNPGYLGGGKTVGEALAVIRGKVGGDAGARAVPSFAGMIDDAPPVRPEALDAERPAVSLAGRAIPVTQVMAADIGVDAPLMQFKAGGDDRGVTERLRGVDQWDPISAGTVTVWEAADGRVLIADGHQRLGLAHRLEAGGHPPIQLNAFVLREADGVSATDARIATALKNIREGSGAAQDAAKVFRAVGLESEAVLRSLPPKSGLVRDGKALARLSDEAFGAIVNEVIPESHGAAIGALVDDRALHAGMVKVLAEASPASRMEAEAVIRQALDAGFVREIQDSLFGAETVEVGLFAQRARLLSGALRELRKLKGAFQVAARNADALDAAGNRIDVAASEAAADGNALALALVEALALRKGNAVNDLLNDAARRIGEGERSAGILRDFVAGVRGLDLEAVARESGGAGDAVGAAGGGGRAGEPALETRDLDSEPLTPAQQDAAAAARPWADHSEPALFAEPDPKWAEPDGEGAAAAAESLWHDLDQVDPGAAARTAQEAQLRADSPLRGENVTGEAQDGEMGLALFDAADQPAFDLGDGRGARAIGDIRAELDADRAAIETIRGCLK